jgi:hypothetical protein
MLALPQEAGVMEKQPARGKYQRRRACTGRLWGWCTSMLDP